MANRQSTFLLRRSNVQDKIPALTGLTIGELALNTADAKLYTLYTSGTTGATEVRQIGWDRLSIISGGTVSGDTIFTSGITANTINANRVEVITAGENLSIGDIVFLSGDSKYYKASNISEDTSSTELRLIINPINANDSDIALITGQYITTGLVSGEIYWLSSGGTYTSTQPSTDGYIVRYLGTALDSNTLEFNPDPLYIEIGPGLPANPTGCITDLYVTNLHSCSPLHINPNNSEGDIYIGENGGVNVGIGTSTPNYLLDVNGTINALIIQATNITGDGSLLTNIPTSSINGLDSELNSLNSHLTNYNNPHQTSFDNLTTTAHTHSIVDIYDLNTVLSGKTNLSLFESHTGDINNPHQTSFDNLTTTAHTHSISDITNLSSNLNDKLSLSGGTITGSLVIQQDFTVLGTATTINTNILAVENNLILLNSNLTGATDQPFFGDSGINILRGSATTATIIWNESSQKFVAGLTGNTKQIILSGDSLSLLNSGHTHPISEITNLQTTLNNKFNTTGGTISGNISATTISATTFYGDGSNLTGLITTDYYVTGGTFSGTTLTLRRNGLADIPITGFTSTGNFLSLTGGTVSGNTTFTTGVTLSSLTGSTDRLVEVNSSGSVSANRAIISAYLTGGTVVTNLVNVSNWSSKNYVGPAITGTYQGQKYYDADYFFEAVDNNVWIRLSRV